ncbi:MAG TPA: tetratricopeptide repeat protein [Terriglobales bacterium]|nr:tetratricopeptide repeat protein [Terriglobales bacterium]
MKAVLMGHAAMHRSYIVLGLISFLAISGLCAATPSVCTPPPALESKLQKNPKADTFAELGSWYGDHDQYNCAIKAYRDALKLEPKSAEVLYLLGLNLLRQGDFSDAVKPLQQSIEIKPDVLKAHLLLATALEELRQPAEARTEWIAALKIDPHSELALDGASKNLLAADNFDAVIALLGPQPKGENLTLDLAAAYTQSGATDQAVEVLKKALEASPTSRPLARTLISELVLQARYQEAAKLGEKLVQQYPRDLEAKILYLHVLVMNDDEQLARPLAKKLLIAAPHDFTVLYLNGLLENRAGNYAGGRDFLEKAVAINPNHYNSHFNLGIALSDLNDPQGAREQFEKALALGAHEPAVRFEYAKVLRKLGETQLAAEQLKLYQEEQKASNEQTMAVNKTAQADKELASGDAKRAVALYRDALAVLPDSALLNYKLSAALDKVGDTAAERDALQKAVQIDPKMAIAHCQLGYLAFNDGDFSTAEEQFREAVQAAPGFTDAWISLAATLATESRRPEALEAVRHALEIDPHNANALALQKDLADAAGQTNP